jgi:hypothetical protein
MSLSGPADIDFAPGKALALRRQAAVEIGGLDPQFWPDAYADVDLALRLRARGWQVRCEPSLQAITLSIEPVLDYHRNRLRLALKHLSPVEWAGRFLPAELERVRAGLLPDAPNWPETGASAIEALARGAGGAGRGLLDPQPFLDAVAALQAVADLASLEVPNRHVRRDPALDAVAAQQDAFNTAVVQAFAAQARLNRELIAELLLTLLDVMSLRRPPGPGR